MSTSTKRRASDPIENNSPVKKQRVDNHPECSLSEHSVPGLKTAEPAIQVSKSGTKVTKTGESTEKRITKSRVKNPPLELVFEPYEDDGPPLDPPFNPAWGLKPFPPNGEGPRSYPDQPSARTSNGQTDPPLWEDRGARIKRGSRFIDVDGGSPIDQNDLILIKLIDMRPKSKTDPTPRRLPRHYRNQHGTPLDWNSKQAIKALNDRRQQNINSHCCELSWSPKEREALASIFSEFPDISIMEATERFNHHFEGDFVDSSGFSESELFTGRTIESVRFEYLSFKSKYDNGEAPKRTQLLDIKAKKHFVRMFGMSAKSNDEDEEDHGDDGDGGDDELSHSPPKEDLKKNKGEAKKSGTVGDSENHQDGDEDSSKSKAKKSEAIVTGSEGVEDGNKAEDDSSKPSASKKGKKVEFVAEKAQPTQLPTIGEAPNASSPPSRRGSAISLRTSASGRRSSSIKIESPVKADLLIQSKRRSSSTKPGSPSKTSLPDSRRGSANSRRSSSTKPTSPFKAESRTSIRRESTPRRRSSTQNTEPPITRHRSSSRKNSG
ncbi:hypothetical protein N0V90_007367 [Kalmusia sp. IMI 367209]|nr:hypothetical protein N0V90_007367 [Kalmusia sp. IMI 367209]